MDQRWPYFQVATTLPTFIAALKRGKPNADLSTWLSAVGVTRSVVPGELAALRRLGWVDESAVTESGWALRGDRASEMADAALKAHYSDLILVAESHPGDGENALDRWLESNSRLGHVARSRVIRTFMQLQELATHGELGVPERPPVRPRPERLRRRSASGSSTSGSSEPGVAPGDPKSQVLTHQTRHGTLTISGPNPMSRKDIDHLKRMVELLEVDESAE